jgi:hypothetical protein
MKKISYNDAAYICRYKEKHFFERYFCNHYIWMNNPNEGIIKKDMKIWFYILTFIPICILQFVCLLWDGGIKHFEIPSINIMAYNVTGLTSDNDDTTMFGRFKQVYNK